MKTISTITCASCGANCHPVNHNLNQAPHHWLTFRPTGSPEHIFLCPKEECQSRAREFNTGERKPSNAYVPAITKTTYYCLGCLEPKEIVTAPPFRSIVCGSGPWTGWMDATLRPGGVSAKSNTGRFCPACVTKIEAALGRPENKFFFTGEHPDLNSPFRND